ncbi:MAG: hypothetical protein J7L71_03420 [Spirochaetaceae bacterium]|nr:hypothetical protein [Spirochaetaceae bacterium]
MFEQTLKNTFLSNTDNASMLLRKELLSSCNLHPVLDLPGEATLREPKEILAEMRVLDRENEGILSSIEDLL